MIGSGDLDVDGIRKDGTSEPLMRRGEWTAERPTSIVAV
jgi:aminopeptidase